jgi:hypothetical protein
MKWEPDRVLTTPQGEKNSLGEAMLKKIRECLNGTAVLAVLTIVSAFWPGPAHAQVSAATLSGIVTDTSGMAVANAALSIKNLDTEVVREVTTNSDGFYSGPNLLPGVYEVAVQANGFSSVVQKGITLTVGSQQAFNVGLKVGQGNTTVEVSTP